MARKPLTDKLVARTRKPTKDEKQLEIWDSTFPGFGLRISYGGQRSFIAIARIKNRLRKTAAGGYPQRRVTIGHYPAISLAEAREQARQFFEDAKVGIDPVEREEMRRRELERQRADTFAAVVDRYMDEHVRAKKLRSEVEIERVLRKHAVPKFGHRPMGEIERSELKKLLADRAKEAPARANYLFANLKALFGWAAREEIIDRTPMDRLERPAPTVERERVLSEDELRLLLEATKTLGPPFDAMIMVLLLSAQRLGEVAAMRWEDLHLAGGSWSLPGEDAKNAGGHLVPLSPLAVEALQGVPRTAPTSVFASGKAGDKPPSGFSKLKKRIDKAMLAERKRQAEENGEDPETVAPIPRWTLHDLRRTAATRMRTLGVDRLTVSKMLNHKEAGVTKIYDRFSMDPEKRHATDVLGSYIEQLMGRQPSNVTPLRAAAGDDSMHEFTG
jgi:integrase